MTIDERLKALTMRLEVVTRVHEDFEKKMTGYAADVKGAIKRLANIAEGARRHSGRPRKQDQGSRKLNLTTVLAVFFRSVGERQPQLPDSFIGGTHRFDAMTSKIVRRLAHVGARVFQRFDGLGNAWMTQTFRLRRHRDHTRAKQRA